ncbi:hypothetical protein SAMN02745129_2540 [Ferrimonas marina]|uniref:Uncharacterized protein n=1 Tax=Ferrimonas marina TaxID=299255 RepID=A0A1M5UF03_9GAMM|nr:hypothetical protein SAMN02745129_2540 [Ferrimonas marina]
MSVIRTLGVAAAVLASLPAVAGEADLVWPAKAQVEVKGEFVRPAHRQGDLQWPKRALADKAQNLALSKQQGPKVKP